ncbi:hypothetical protein [Pygmaiobacter massiliensis]|uniref:hypothetical protein n=1 Tax=Pygmaiobacter massiliensis TaxID=1917873 RepID=UPI002A8273D9|nr:hypothetical protein [Pygmaiobacter massiliensis]MDY4783393.1 hypothetical protein [Pygmaiobacter massiliensis]
MIVIIGYVLSTDLCVGLLKNNGLNPHHTMAKEVYCRAEENTYCYYDGIAVGGVQ